MTNFIAAPPDIALQPEPEARLVNSSTLTDSSRLEPARRSPDRRSTMARLKLDDDTWAERQRLVQTYAALFLVGLAGVTVANDNQVVGYLALAFGAVCLSIAWWMTSDRAQRTVLTSAAILLPNLALAHVAHYSPSAIQVAWLSILALALYEQWMILVTLMAITVAIFPLEAHNPAFTESMKGAGGVARTSLSVALYG